MSDTFDIWVKQLKDTIIRVLGVPESVFLLKPEYEYSRFKEDFEKSGYKFFQCPKCLEIKAIIKKKGNIVVCKDCFKICKRWKGE